MSRNFIFVITNEQFSQNLPIEVNISDIFPYKLSNNHYLYGTWIFVRYSVMLRNSLKTCMIILLAKQDSTYDECRANGRIFGFLKIKSDTITGALKPGKKLKLDALKVQYSASVSHLKGNA